MKHYKRLYSIYRTIKRGRCKKKLDTYKTIVSLSIDKTVLIYTLLLIGYIGVAIFISGDFTYDIRQLFTFIERVGMEYFLLIASLYPMRYVFQSLRRPGIIFSSTEYQLSMLPYSLRSVWNVVVFDKWMKNIAVGLIIWIVLSLTPLSWTFVGIYVLFFVGIDLVMTAPLWRLYQQPFFVKLLLFIVLGSSVGFLARFNPLLAACIATLSIIIWNIVAWKRLMRNVQWGRITSTSDFHIWNLPFVSQITKVPFKREKRIYVLQHISYRRNRLSYKASSIHKRLWQSYMIKSTRTIFQLLGSFLVLLTVLAFVREFVFYIGIAVTIYMFTSSSASIFYDRFRSDILQVLPWDLSTFKQTFLRWNIYGGVIISIPIILYFVYNFTWWVPMQALLCVSVFLYMLHYQVERSAVLIARENKKFIVPDIIASLGLIVIVLSASHTFVSLFAFVYVFLLIRLRQKSMQEQNTQTPHILI